MPATQIVSKQRVADHGEVYTNPREVNAMLDLVKVEAERIESRFLEPACGTGNFLVEILSRKLDVAATRYKRSKNQLHYERDGIQSVASIYGIELLSDNVAICRERLSTLAEQRYTELFGNRANPQYLAAVRSILTCNILHGDALTLETPEKKPIVFAEWSMIDSRLKRRDYEYRHLIQRNRPDETADIFSGSLSGLPPQKSDTGEECFIAIPIRDDYPLIHFLEVSNV
ncbi:hypothetical protein A7Q01_05295 [Eikenella sp. NML96-A-049]|uniref:hypothetical protein n=1 Tax=unclassified Eikenella TaxID=2639367 RepID=UPI0007E17C9F|nr:MULTISPECIES: hypothetical protein [unclassified Eikenella]OAM34142.1 hypothetical protein A7P97_02640 [Eikenella sp. NML070372]OAM38887.1 hypothetical protein A7Q01_05295 [Eikenella sp. NML96-A-049]VDH00910.1 Uncharacterised protein [Helicobacter pametensis]